MSYLKLLNIRIYSSFHWKPFGEMLTVVLEAGEGEGIRRMGRIHQQNCRNLKRKNSWLKVAGRGSLPSFENRDG